MKKFLSKVGPGYYSYDGSLTTPGCNQVVTFIIMEKAIAISQEQVRNIEKLLAQTSAHYWYWHTKVFFILTLCFLGTSKWFLELKQHFVFTQNQIIWRKQNLYRYWQRAEAIRLGMWSRDKFLHHLWFLQIDAFKGLSYNDGSPMVDNFRPPQPLNNRVVKRMLPMNMV